jgi:hypothetical protein
MAPRTDEHGKSVSLNAKHDIPGLNLSVAPPKSGATPFSLSHSSKAELPPYKWKTGERYPAGLRLRPVAQK